MVLGKKAAIFDWEWGRNSAPREGQKIPCVFITYLHVCILRDENSQTFSIQKTCWLDPEWSHTDF